LDISFNNQGVTNLRAVAKSPAWHAVEMAGSAFIRKRRAEPTASLDRHPVDKCGKNTANGKVLFNQILNELST